MLKSKILVTMIDKNGDKEELFAELDKPFKIKDGRIFKISTSFDIEELPMMIYPRTNDCGIDCDDKIPHRRDYHCFTICVLSHSPCIPVEEVKHE